jgi:Fe-S-cluster containining protein
MQLSSVNGPLPPMSREAAEHAALRYGLPFVPAHQHPDGRWDWSCTQLQKDGRCGIYEDRPQLCRTYAAGSDPLCVHYWADPAPAEAAAAATSANPEPTRL